MDIVNDYYLNTSTHFCWNVWSHNN